MAYNLSKFCESLYCTPVTYNTVHQLYFNLKKRTYMQQAGLGPAPACNPPLSPSTRKAEEGVGQRDVYFSGM